MQQQKISMRGITKVFATDEMETHALRGIDLQIFAGDFVSICGPSGCGKSTLLSLLGLLDMPTEGSYQIEGQEVSGLSLSEAAFIRNEKIGFIFQSFNLIDELTVFDNIALPLRYRRNAVPKAELQERVMACLKTVDMSHRAGHRPNQLSGGQQQRIAIARMLLKNPCIMIFDEATSSLDSTSEKIILKTLNAIATNRSTLVIAHRLSTVVDADTILVLDHGQLVEQGTHTKLIEANGLYAELWHHQQRKHTQTSPEML